MTDLLEHSAASSLRSSPAFGQVVRRWVAAVLMYLAAILGVLGHFGGTASVGGTTNTVSGSAQLTLIAVGAGLTLLCVLPTVGLVRHIRQQSDRAGRATIVAGSLVILASALGFFMFVFFGVLMVVVGLPLSRFRKAA